MSLNFDDPRRRMDADRVAADWAYYYRGPSNAFESFGFEHGTPVESGLEQAEESDGNVQGRSVAGQGGTVVYGPWPGSAPQGGEDGGG